jgi:hypothetical protein
LVVTGQPGQHHTPSRPIIFLFDWKLDFDAKYAAGSATIGKITVNFAVAGRKLFLLIVDTRALSQEFIAFGKDRSYRGASGCFIHAQICRVSLQPSQSVRIFFLFLQRDSAARRAISRRFSGDNSMARARPPASPPFARFGALPLVSSISPVAIRATMTAAPITSAGRRSPLGPRGIGNLRNSAGIIANNRAQRDLCHNQTETPPSSGNNI